MATRKQAIWKRTGLAAIYVLAFGAMTLWAVDWSDNTTVASKVAGGTMVAMGGAIAVAAIPSFERGKSSAKAFNAASLAMIGVGGTFVTCSEVGDFLQQLETDGGSWWLYAAPAYGILLGVSVFGLGVAFALAWRDTRQGPPN